MEPFTVINGGTASKLDDIIPDYQKEMMDLIDDIDQQCWNKNTGYIAKNFPLITEATAGFEDGLYFVAATANCGKSALMMNIIYDLIQNQDNDMIALYFSLDDSIIETIPRIVAMIENLKIDVIRKPLKYEKEVNLITRRQRGIDKLKKISNRLIVKDSTTVQSIEDIENTIKEYKIKLKENGMENTKFIIVIDSFHDLDSRTKRFSSSNEKFEFMSKWAKDLTKMYECIVICTAHLRKLNGNRRPILDDVKESGTIVYEANCIMLCHNDVGVKGERAEIFYERDGFVEKQPVIEIHFAKNKLSSFKGRLFAQFIPEYSKVIECTSEEIKQYNSQMFGA